MLYTSSNLHTTTHKQGPLPSAALTFRFWQALGETEVEGAQPPVNASTSHAAAATAIEAAVLHFVVALVRRSTLPPGFPAALSLGDRQALEDFRCE